VENVFRWRSCYSAIVEAVLTEGNWLYNLQPSVRRQNSLSPYNDCMVRSVVGLVTSAVVVTSALQPLRAQTPRPFPRPETAHPARPAEPAPRSPASPGAQAQPTAADAPTEANLGFPIHPSAQFIASYDAGRAQRYYIFGSTVPYADLVIFYRTQLKERGDQVFEQPPTHMFEVGRFRNETMAFPPGVTIKDWTWSGSQGYPNPAPGAQPARFPTLIMIVPAPAAVGSRQ
jgi:hypothetical protein